MAASVLAGVLYTVLAPRERIQVAANSLAVFDPDNGEIVEKIQLAPDDPLPHGLTIWEGTLWYCDDIGVVCKMKI